MKEIIYAVCIGQPQSHNKAILRDSLYFDRKSAEESMSGKVFELAIKLAKRDGKEFAFLLEEEDIYLKRAEEYFEIKEFVEEGELL